MGEWVGFEFCAPSETNTTAMDATPASHDALLRMTARCSAELQKLYLVAQDEVQMYGAISTLTLELMNAVGKTMMLAVENARGR